MGIQQFSPEELDELKLRFKGVLEVDNKLDELKDQSKLFTSSKNEMLKNIAEKMEIGVKEVKKGYEAYVKSIRDPDEVEALEEVFVFIKEYNMLGQEKK